jgi:hypothetical protein
MLLLSPKTRIAVIYGGLLNVEFARNLINCIKYTLKACTRNAEHITMFFLLFKLHITAQI